MGLEAELLDKIANRSAVVAVVGLGYVGLPVATAFAEAGFPVRGVDSDADRVSLITKGESPVRDVEDGRLKAVLGSGLLQVSSSYDVLAEADAILVSLPTPLREGVPDLSLVVNGGTSIAKVLRRGSLVILESTTYPGTTEEILRPLLEKGGLKAEQDFFLAYSPERIDPGNEKFEFTDIPKVVGGIDDASTRVAAALYEHVVPVVTVSGTKEAELSKLIENTFRHVNIALVNELAVYANEMGIDIWESIEAAATKPFGFIPFWPGPGWGGHCIPLDPAYLSWRVKQHRSHEVRFVELAHAVNSEMPRYVVERISLLLNNASKSLRGAKILCIGAAYKGGTEDTRESPSLKVLSGLIKRGADVSYHDPLVAELAVDGTTLMSRQMTSELLGAQDLVLVLVRQDGVDWALIEEEASAVLDCCNAFGKKTDKIERL